VIYRIESREILSFIIITFEKINNTCIMSNQNPSANIYDTTIRLFFMALIIAWCLAILYPFFNILLWSLILGIALHPLHSSMVKLMGGKAKLAAFILVLLGLAIVIVPMWFFLDAIVKEVKELKASFQAGTLTLPPPSEKVKSWPVIGNSFYDLWASASLNLEETIIKYKDQLAGLGAKVAKGILSTAGGILQMMISLVIAGFLLNVKGLGESIRKFYRKVAGNRGDEFADVTYKTIGKVVKGVMGVALIQATLIGLGFLLAGVPYAGIWTLFVFILAVLQLPVILVVIPVIIYLFAEKELLPAVLWGIYLLLAGASENIFKPLLLGKGAPVPMLVIFIGVIGGFIFSGFIGLFTGAIIVSIGYKLFITWLDTAEPKT
jgi:predicted PurR-regulated permease PerM